MTRRRARSAATSQCGFTLAEFIFTIVTAAILAKVAIARFVPPGAITTYSQALAAADTVRRAQILATAGNKRHSATVSSSAVTIACIASAPCPTDGAYSVTQDVAMGNGGTIYFNTLGIPVNNLGVPLAADASFTISHPRGQTFTVTISALTGHVSVTP